MSELRWGIVGCGDVVEKKSGPSIVAGNRSRITAVMRRDLAKLEAFAVQHEVPLRTADPSEVITSPDVDIVYVATPPHLHYAYVVAAAQAGKHVLVEKPMGMNAGESNAMVEACAHSGHELFVAYYRRFQPHVAKMAELISDGAIGDLIHVKVEFAQAYRQGFDWGWRTQPDVSGGGLFADLLSHRIDLAISFLGEPQSVAGERRKVYPDSIPEDLVSLVIGFQSGAQATVIGNFATSMNLDRFVLTGTHGEIATDSLDGHAFTLRRSGKQPESMSFDRFPAPHLGLVRHIEQALASGRVNGVAGSEGVWTDWILDEGVRGVPCKTG